MVLRMFQRQAQIMDVPNLNAAHNMPCSGLVHVLYAVIVLIAVLCWIRHQSYNFAKKRAVYVH